MVPLTVLRSGARAGRHALRRREILETARGAFYAGRLNDDVTWQGHDLASSLIWDPASDLPVVSPDTSRLGIRADDLTAHEDVNAQLSVICLYIQYTPVYGKRLMQLYRFWPKMQSEYSCALRT